MASEALKAFPGLDYYSETFEMVKKGSVFRMASRRGQLLELSDGSFECHMRDGAVLKVCCWKQGIYALAPGHDGGFHCRDCRSRGGGCGS